MLVRMFQLWSGNKCHSLTKVMIFNSLLHGNHCNKLCDSKWDNAKLWLKTDLVPDIVSLQTVVFSWSASKLQSLAFVPSTLAHNAKLRVNLGGCEQLNDGIITQKCPQAILLDVHQKMSKLTRITKANKDMLSHLSGGLVALWTVQMVL